MAYGTFDPNDDLSELDVDANNPKYRDEAPVTRGEFLLHCDRTNRMLYKIFSNHLPHILERLGIMEREFFTIKAYIVATAAVLAVILTLFEVFGR